MSLRKYSFAFTIAAVLSISFFLRVYALEKYPFQINQDELSNLYDGYSIAETGADRWGMQHPFILRGFGDNDYRPPMYAWICALTVKIFGYSVFAGRFPSAVLGLLSLVFLFLVSKKIGGKLFSFFVLLSAAFSPWHLLFSRMALEAATLTSFFMILSFYLWITMRQNKYSFLFVIILGLTAGLGTNTYQSSKLIFSFLGFIFFIDLIKHSEQPFKKACLFSLFFLIGASPQLLVALTMPEHFIARAGNTMMPYSFSCDYFNTFFRNFFANLSPDFLFFSTGEYNNLSRGRLLAVDFPFFYLGFFFFNKVIEKTRMFHPSFLYLLIAISIFPSALTSDNPHALRASCLMILLPFITGAGILFVLGKIKNTLLRTIFPGIIVLLMLANAIFNINIYMNSYFMRNAIHQNFLVLLSEKLNTYKDNYSRIYIENIGNQLSLYVVSYCNMKPSEFQKAAKQFDGDRITQVGKYYFLDRDKIDNEIKTSPVKCLFILQSKQDNYHLIDSMENEETGQKTFFHEK